jgi:hypothetical protein
VGEPEFKNIWQINFYGAYASIPLNEAHFKKKYFFGGGFREVETQNFASLPI